MSSEILEKLEHVSSGADPFHGFVFDPKDIAALCRAYRDMRAFANRIAIMRGRGQDTLDLGRLILEAQALVGEASAPQMREPNSAGAD